MFKKMWEPYLMLIKLVSMDINHILTFAATDQNSRRSFQK